MGLLDGKVILITGSTSGIGAATAIEAAKEGASVVISGRRQDKGEAVLKKITDAGGKAHFVKTDVTVLSDIDNLFAETIRVFGRLDGAFNNVGYALFKPFESITVEEWEAQQKVNVTSIFYATKLEAAQFKTQGGGGSVVNCSSIASKFGGVGIPTAAYTASKYALNGLTKASAAEFAKDKIRFNAVLPGPVAETDIIPEGFSVNAFVKHILLERVGLPQEIAKVVVFLLSDNASFINGTEVIVDGGLVEYKHFN